MSLTGKLYVTPCDEKELKEVAAGDKKLIDIEEDRRGLAELQQFIGHEYKDADKRELTTSEPFSFTLFKEVSTRERSKRQVIIPIGTILYFFDKGYFTFNEDDHSLVVNLRTGVVKYRRNRFAAHVLVKSPALHQRLN